MSYKPGQSVRLFVTWTDVDGNLVNPPAVSHVVHSPSGTTYATTPVNDSTGKYHADFLVPMSEMPGNNWTSRWQATGGVPSQNALVEEDFTVDPLDF